MPITEIVSIDEAMIVLTQRAANTLDYLRGFGGDTALRPPCGERCDAGRAGLDGGCRSIAFRRW